VARETNIRNGGTGLNVTVCKNTCDKIFEDIDTSAEIGQTTTKARYRESKDVRNFVSMAVMNEAYALDKPPQMIENYDATQLVVSLKNQELLITIKREHLNGSCDDGNLPLTNVEDSPLDFGIKWMMTANAIGHLGMDVFLVNDPHMDADAISLYEITGLTHRSDPKASGWLVFCKTRAGTATFFKWYTTEIMLKFAHDCRQLLPEIDRSQNFYMIADGEAIQIQPYDDEDVLSEVEKFNVEFQT
jgi:hypothetical protein